MKIIHLLGVGGNFKTSLLNNPIFKDYIKISECNSESLFLYDELHIIPTPHYFLITKYLVFKNILLNNLQNKSIITDRSLIDYHIFHEIMSKGVTPHYKPVIKSPITEELIIQLYDKLFSLYQNTYLFIKTLDLDFLDSIINGKINERSLFYDTVDMYLECQELYESKCRKIFNKKLKIYEVTNAYELINLNFVDLILKIFK